MFRVVWKWCRGTVVVGYTYDVHEFTVRDGQNHTYVRRYGLLNKWATCKLKDSLLCIQLLLNA